MSENLEFVDEDDEVFRANRDSDQIDFTKYPEDGTGRSVITFYAKDAEEIIKLIRDAAQPTLFEDHNEEACSDGSEAICRECWSLGDNYE